MAVLSGAPAGTAMQGRDRTPARLVKEPGKSKLPPGIRLDIEPTDPTKPPDRDHSLHDFYRWHFQRARDYTELWKLVQLAERDLWDYAHTGQSTADRDSGRNRSILSSKYKGQPPAIVAALERCTSAHVQKLRKANGLHPTTAEMADHA